MFKPSRHTIRLAMALSISSLEALKFVSAGPARNGEGRRREGKYIPAGPRRNCGHLGISPKSVTRYSQQRTPLRLAA